MNGYFITGTDTGVGKTFVTCALARRARQRGHRVFAFKPMETGCAEAPDGSLVGADQDLLVEAAGAWQTGPLRGLYRYPLPAAPLVSAAAVGAVVDLSRVAAATLDGAANASFTLVEGAGGWRVPITPDADMAAMARVLGLPVLVVARAGLGTINHTLLTLEAIERDGAPVAGVVFSCRPDDDPEAAESNRAQVLRRWSGRLEILRADPNVLDGWVPAAASPAL